MAIYPLTAADLQHIPSIQPSDWHDITPFIRYYVESPHCTALKLVEDDTMVAIGAVIYHQNSAWLAHILVHAQHRNRGLGKRITQALIDEVDQRTHPTIWLITTDLGEPVYRKLGFEVESEYAVYRWEQGRYASSNVETIPYAAKWRQQLLELDAYITGEKRETTLQDYLEETRLICHGEELQGVYFPTLDNGLILAKNADAGTQLMTLRRADFPHANMPVANKIARAFLAGFGLEPRTHVKRMVLGKSMDWHPELVFNRIGGHLG